MRSSQPEVSAHRKENFSFFILFVKVEKENFLFFLFEAFLLRKKTTTTTNELGISF